MNVQLAEVARIAEQVKYDPETGLFTSKVTKRGWPASRIMGGRDANGYIILKVDGKAIKAHRLAWFMQTGRLPRGVIDHINGSPADNRIINLRDVSKQVNNLNSSKARRDNSNRLRGVQKISGMENRWAARITKNGKRVHLGCFESPEQAHQAYIQARDQRIMEALNAL